jgi:hypothetical protein
MQAVSENNHRLKEQLDTQRRSGCLALAQVCRDLPLVAKTYGLKPSMMMRAVAPLPRAAIRMQLAVAKTTRGDDLSRAAQQRAIAVLTMAATRLQSARTLQILDGPVADAGDVQDPNRGGEIAHVGPPRTHAVKFFGWCWDESEQKLQRFRSRDAFARHSQTSTSTQILVQSGLVGKNTLVVASDTMQEEVDRILVRPVRLENLSSDVIFEGISKSLPGGSLTQLLDDMSAPKDSEIVDATWLFLGADRAGQSYVIAEVIFQTSNACPEGSAT